MTFIFGALAALAAPLVMTCGFIVWDNHWKGSAFALNLFKCNLASIGFLVLSASTGSLSFRFKSVGYLMLSSTIGILIGDWTWLQGLQLLGATRVIFVDSIKPFLAALMGWAILGEKLEPAAAGGIALTMIGIILVSVAKEKKKKDDPNDHAVYSGGSQSGKDVEGGGDQIHEKDSSVDEITQIFDSVESMMKNNAPKSTDDNSAPKVDDSKKKEHKSSSKDFKSKKELRLGYFYSGINVILDTYGSLLTKQFAGDMTPWEISLVRFGFSGSIMLIVSLGFHTRDYLRKREEDVPSSNPTIKEDSKIQIEIAWYALPLMPRHSWLKIVGGVAFVTFLTPILSNYALLEIALALTLTLTSVGPLYALPLGWWLQNERPTTTAWIGALLAVGGVAVLSFFGKSG